MHGDLNESQRGVVLGDGGAHLVVAGAGTGKTRTLVHRVAHLIASGVEPHHVVLLTFTRRAADEMLGRVADAIGPGGRAVRGGTFHGFALQALRRHADALGWTPAFTVLDREDAAALVGLVRSELGFAEKAKRFPRKETLLDLHSRAVNTGRPLGELIADQFPQHVGYQAQVEAVIARYAERKQAQGVMDFDDLLVLLARLLRDHPSARQSIAEACHHVLVDEFQDTNRLQAEIAVWLASVHGNLMVVGDEAQSIYGFRGADVRNILDFPALFPGCHVSRLEDNYRSVQPVLDLANGVLAAAREGFGKQLRARVAGGELPVIVDTIDEHEQARAVVDNVLTVRAAGVPLAQQAILCRSAHHAHLVEVELAARRLPFRKYGGLRFAEAAHVKDVLALLRIVSNPRDVLAWFRVLVWFEGLGERTAQKIGDEISAADDPVLDPARFKGRAYQAALADLAAQLDAWAPLAVDPVPCVEAVLAWYVERFPDLYEDWKRRVKDLDAMPLLAERHGSLEAFLAAVALDPLDEAGAADAPEAEEAEVRDTLVISTIHSAKGLEWDAVHVLQLADGGFPSTWSLDDESAMEEELRLLYVAVTRARKHLALYAPHFVRTRGAPPSPGCSLLDRVPDLHRLVRRGRPAPPPPGRGGGEDPDLPRRLQAWLRR